MISMLHLDHARWYRVYFDCTNKSTENMEIEGEKIVCVKNNTNTDVCSLELWNFK